MRQYNNNHTNENSQDKMVGIVPNSVLFNRKTRNSKKVNCPLSGKNAPIVDYKNLALLSQYVSEKGRLIPSRITQISAIKQRALKRAVKIARVLALLPFSAEV